MNHVLMLTGTWLFCVSVCVCVCVCHSGMELGFSPLCVHGALMLFTLNMCSERDFSELEEDQEFCVCVGVCACVVLWCVLFWWCVYVCVCTHVSLQESEIPFCLKLIFKPSKWLRYMYWAVCANSSDMYVSAYE